MKYKQREDEYKKDEKNGEEGRGDGRESVHGKMGDRQDESLCVHGSRRLLGTVFSAGRGTWS